MVESDSGLHRKKEKKSDESKLLITLALFFIFILFHYLPSSFFRGGWRVSGFE
jgi:hypothetical protein